MPLSRAAAALLLTLPLASRAGVWSGTLESRVQFDDLFDDGNYAEQWLTLDHRDRQTQRTFHLLANYGLSTNESWMKLHSAYLEQPLPGRDLKLRAGRFDRWDSAGAYTLDGVQLDWERQTERWTFYTGAPRRQTLYFIPGSEEEVNEPQADFLAGAFLSRAQTQGRWGLGLRYYGAGATAWKLDGQYSRRWPRGEEAIRLDAALTLALDDSTLESFDLQASMPLEAQAQLVLRSRRYDPPEKAVTFRDRYYGYYAHGWQTVIEAGYDASAPNHLGWSAYLRSIQRETGLDGTGADLTLHWRLADGSTLEGHAEWLQGGGEAAGGLFLGHQRTLNSRLLLNLDAALRRERHDRYGDRTIVAAEVRLQWMWRRDLHLDARLELAHADDEAGGYDQIRTSLNLIYHLPARGMEDYR